MTSVLAAAAPTIRDSEGFLIPVGHHELLLFWIQLVVLLGVARLLGGLMRRAGQPAVVGELAAGLLIGPSVLGRFAPGLTNWLFPGGEVESALLLAVSWFGIFLLLIVTGFETDLGLLRRLGRPAVNVSVGSLVVPLAAGIGLGWVMPSSFIGGEDGRLGFALFMGVALSISALPVIAKILGDMNLMRRNFGQITIAAGMANDLIGWILLGVVSGIVASGRFDVTSLLVTLAAVGVFLGLSLTLGQRATDYALRRARGAEDSFTGALTVTLLIALVAGAITHAIGVEAVLGALVAGIVVGRSRYQHSEVEHTLETLSNAIFAPVFFATAGLYVDFGVIFQGTNWVWAIAVIAVAALAKLVGSYLGARRSGMSQMEGLATGLGLNARGALEIVVATIGYSLGVLNDVSYAIIVVMAIVTSMAAPPLLRPVLARLTANPEEEQRLHREKTLESSVIASARNVLLPTRGGANSVAAARLLDLSLQPEATVTVLSVHAPQDRAMIREDVVDDIVMDAFEHRAVSRRRHTAEDMAADVLQEASLGYDLMVVGVTEFVGTHELSEPLRRIIASTPIPVLLIRRGTDPQADPDHIRSVLVPVTGTKIGRAAEEIAYVLGARLGAHVDALHIVARAAGGASMEGQLERSRELAARFGGDARTITRVATVQHEAIHQEAEDRGADLIVIGAQTRSVGEDRPFLGYGAEYLLEHASATVVAVVFPAETD